MQYPLALSVALTALFSASASAQTWENHGSPATVVELFTSEGCSSCPPADAALNRLAAQEGLWTEVIPLAFHVDYWNYIGWPDRFAKPEFSQRQRQKVTQANASGVYTPGWFINDQEWRGFFSRQPVPFVTGPKAASLTANLEGSILNLHYGNGQSLKAHYALLAMNQRTDVKRGENRGKTLEHNFVVVAFGEKAGQGEWRFTVPDTTADAIAVWLTPTQGGDPVQTVAGWLGEPR